MSRLKSNLERLFVFKLVTKGTLDLCFFGGGATFSVFEFLALMLICVSGMMIECGALEGLTAG